MRQRRPLHRGFCPCEYAAITVEIKEVARQLGVEYLADSSLEELMKNLGEIRKSVGNDRAILRSIHFFLEDERAVLQKKAVSEDDIDSLLKLMRESGRSSFEYLQNVNVSSRPQSQSLALGLAVADKVLKGEGACRVHGGGFEGTIQIVVPEEKLEELKKEINNVFGEGSLMELRVRPVGTLTVV